MSMPTDPLHVSEVAVMQCGKAECQGTESGCPGSACNSARGFRYWSHQRFVDTFGRCPVFCKANKIVKPGGLKKRLKPDEPIVPFSRPTKAPLVTGRVVKWKRKS